MADLIAIGYPDEATAEAAADEARRLAQDLIIQPDAIAVIVRDNDGSYHVHTNHHTVGAGATWGMFWGLLFGLLFFIPVFGMAVGAGLGALMGKLTKTSIDKQFQDQVRDMLKPGTSALFLMLEKVTPDKAVDAMSKYGGTVLKTSLSKEDEKRTPGRPARRRDDRAIADSASASRVLSATSSLQVATPAMSISGSLGHPPGALQALLTRRGAADPRTSSRGAIRTVSPGASGRSMRARSMPGGPAVPSRRRSQSTLVSHSARKRAEDGVVEADERELPGDPDAERRRRRESLRHRLDRWPRRWRSAGRDRLSRRTAAR